jgi:hypothetical protein
LHFAAENTLDGVARWGSGFARLILRDVFSLANRPNFKMPRRPPQSAAANVAAFHFHHKILHP